MSYVSVSRYTCNVILQLCIEKCSAVAFLCAHIFVIFYIKIVYVILQI